MNIGYEDNELKPYKEPEEGVENKRIGNARMVKWNSYLVWQTEKYSPFKRWLWCNYAKQLSHVNIDNQHCLKYMLVDCRISGINFEGITFFTCHNKLPNKDICNLVINTYVRIPHLITIYFFVTEIMMNMGYSRKEIEDSLSQNKYDDITATYLLLGRRTMEVGKSFK